MRGPTVLCKTRALCLHRLCTATLRRQSKVMEMCVK